MGSRRTLVIGVDGGRITESRVVDGLVEDVVKEVLAEVLPKWSPRESDLIVMRHEHEVTLRLPLDRELHEALVGYGLRKKAESEAVAKIPVYVVSYGNRWVGDELVDERLYLIAPYVNEELRRTVELLAEDLTTPEAKGSEE